MVYLRDITIFSIKVRQTFTFYCPPGGVDHLSTRAPVLTGIVQTRIHQVSTPFSRVASSTNTHRALLNVDTRSPIRARINQTPVLLIANATDPAHRTLARKRRTVPSSTVAAILTRIQSTRVKVWILAVVSLVAAGAVTGECLVLKVVLTGAAVLAWVGRLTKVDRDFTLFARSVWFTATCGRVGHALTVVTAWGTSFFTKVNKPVTRTTLPS